MSSDREMYIVLAKSVKSLKESNDRMERSYNKLLVWMQRNCKEELILVGLDGDILLGTNQTKTK